MASGVVRGGRVCEEWEAYEEVDWDGEDVGAERS